uniref:Uncharacterized protein n=1 Tax=Ixodes ricinus TaxID=34613 RepID=A0A6B0U890_IXORI
MTPTLTSEFRPASEGTRAASEALGARPRRARASMTSPSTPWVRSAASSGSTSAASGTPTCSALRTSSSTPCSPTSRPRRCCR